MFFIQLLIIGASGFIGSHLYKLAVEKGHKVIGTYSKTEKPNLIKFDLLSDRITDVFEPNIFKNDEVFAIICSAIPKIDRCYIEKDLSFRLNVTNTIRMIEDLNKVKIKCIFLSSEAVYDGLQGYYDETMLPTPVNEYGRQKAEVEEYILDNCNHNLILRLSMIVGDDPRENHLFAQWYKWMRTNQPITCIADQVFAPTFVDDVADGILKALDKGLSGLYNLANSEFFAREELAKQFVYALNGTTNITSLPIPSFNFPERRSLKTYLDGTKFRNAVEMNFTSMREVFRNFIRFI